MIPTLTRFGVVIICAGLAFLAAVWLAGCEELTPEPVPTYPFHSFKFRDEAARVTCWSLDRSSLSCLRDEPDGGAR